MNLDKATKRQILRDSKDIIKNIKLKIAYYEEDSSEEEGYTPGYGDYENEEEDNSGWTDYDTYYGSTKTVKESNIREYDFASVVEGDLLFILPNDTDLPVDKEKYKIDYGNREYDTRSGVIPYIVFDNTPLYYILKVTRD